MTEPLTVPLALLATELGRDPDKLAASLGDDVLVDSVGLRVVEVATARRLLDQHRASQAALRRRVQARRQRLAEASQHVHDGLLGGIPATPDGDPFSDIAAVDGTPARIQETESRMELWLAGRSEGALYSPTKAT